MVAEPMTVWDATQRRLDALFTQFDNIVVSFSGGKDSGVMTNIVLDYMRRHRITRKISLLHIDYEAQYTATTDYVTEVMTSNRDLVDPVWICLPLAAGCAVNMSQEYWQPWNPDEQDLWMRPLPEHPGVIHDGTVPKDFPAYRGVKDYVVQARITRWLHHRSRATRTAVLIGIRQQESLSRWAAINRADRNTDSLHQGMRYTSRIYKNVYNAYPIHDWTTEDVWTANGRNYWTYNRLYDLMYTAGVPLNSMRVSSPFLGEGQESLRMYRVIEPGLWARLVGRVNGANFTAIYAGTSAMGVGKIRLPAGHTWKSYCEFLLRTLPDDLRARYERKFATSLKYWTKGGALPVDMADEIRAAGTPGVEFLGPPTDARARVRPAEIVRFKEYPDDLPEITEFNLAPTYKRMVVAILRNDHACKSLGFGPTKYEAAKRAEAIKKYRSIL